MSSQNTIGYRCVCGTTIEIDATMPGRCGTCGRPYGGAVADPSLSMTIGMPVVPVDAEDEMTGTSLDHFTITDRLGGGGMGTVYRALDESLQRYVALKVLRAGGEGSTGSLQVERLLQEARAQARISHPNVVHIYFVSRDEQLPYLAMELVPGDTLKQRLESGPLAYGQVVEVGLQIATALAESAKLDIVHGDIKPANILLSGPVANLSDFGLAQRLSRRRARRRNAGLHGAGSLSRRTGRHSIGPVFVWCNVV